jgi:hypothetical protein
MPGQMKKVKAAIKEKGIQLISYKRSSYFQINPGFMSSKNYLSRIFLFSFFFCLLFCNHSLRHLATAARKNSLANTLKILGDRYKDTAPCLEL